jgi:hypothetical protein
MGTLDTLMLLLKAGTDSHGRQPHLTVFRSPLTGPAALTVGKLSRHGGLDSMSHAPVTNGGIWVNSGALLVRRSTWV